MEGKKELQYKSIQRNILCDYQFGEVLGHGHFATVRKATRKKNPDKAFAVKTLQKAKLEDHLKFFKLEIEILKVLDHPNIVKFYEVYEDTKFIHIVMEHCSGGELFDRIIQKGVMTEQVAAFIFEKMLRAVLHLHQNGIAHRDIKAENFLFASNDSEAEIKLIDFGLSAKFIERDKMQTLVGSPHYVAPEVLTGNYGKECDI